MLVSLPVCDITSSDSRWTLLFKVLLSGMKVTIVGIGKVGSTLPFALTSKSLASELVLLGRDEKSVPGDVLDLEHAQSFVPVPAQIRTGSLEAAGLDILVICASVPRPQCSPAALCWGRGM